MKKFPALFLILFLVIIGLVELYYHSQIKPGPAVPPPDKLATGYDTAPLPSPVSSPSATPKPTLSPQEYEAQYRPCITIPILMYHHVNSAEAASAGGYSGLNVTPAIFQSQLEYLKEKNYHVIPVSALNDFFDKGIKPPSKPVILTFDDGYADFTDVAAPILTQLNFPSTLFVPTGLVENPGYTTWTKLASLPASLFYYGNHTWSHHNMVSNSKTIEFELGTADTQLKEHNFNQEKIFAYPYGPSSTTAISWLKNHEYTLGFTTVHNTLQCKGLRYTLGRIRIGNTTLSAYGL